MNAEQLAMECELLGGELSALGYELEGLQASRRDAADTHAHTGSAKAWLALGEAERALDAKMRERSRVRETLRAAQATLKNNSPAP